MTHGMKKFYIRVKSRNVVIIKLNKLVLLVNF